MSSRRRHWRNPGPEGLEVTELEMDQVSPEVAEYFTQILEQRRRDDQVQTTVAPDDWHLADAVSKLTTYPKGRRG